jgi:hypothetical protein
VLACDSFSLSAWVGAGKKNTAPGEYKTSSYNSTSTPRVYELRLNLSVICLTRILTPIYVARILTLPTDHHGRR